MMLHSRRYAGNCRPISTIPAGCLTRSVVLHANVLALSPNDGMVCPESHRLLTGDTCTASNAHRPGVLRECGASEVQSWYPVKSSGQAGQAVR